MTNKLNIGDFFSTTDLGVATVVSLYFPLHTIDKDNPRHAIFLFEKNPELSKLVEQLWQKKLLIEPLDLLGQLKMVKTRLYQEK